MKTITITTKVNKKGQLELKGLPLQDGDVVDIIILKHERRGSYPLHNSEIKYDASYEPVADES